MNVAIIIVLFFAFVRVLIEFSKAESLEAQTTQLKRARKKASAKMHKNRHERNFNKSLFDSSGLENNQSAVKELSTSENMQAQKINRSGFTNL
ncbi:MAG: hypothetical protein KDD56_09795 [Bdellovibrionales bacterium]|nr:hypothetical protein [Bdellovibrionales bacterium]